MSETKPQTGPATTSPERRSSLRRIMPLMPPVIATAAYAIGEFVSNLSGQTPTVSSETLKPVNSGITREYISKGQTEIPRPPQREGGDIPVVVDPYHLNGEPITDAAVKAVGDSKYGVPQNPQQEQPGNTQNFITQSQTEIPQPPTTREGGDNTPVDPNHWDGKLPQGVDKYGVEASQDTASSSVDPGNQEQGQQGDRQNLILERDKKDVLTKPSPNLERDLNNIYNQGQAAVEKLEADKAANPGKE